MPGDSSPTPPEKSRPPQWIRSAALATNMGFSVGTPLFLGILAGNYLDKRFGGHGLILTLMLLFGVIVGLYGAVRSLTKGFPWKR